MSEGCNWLLRDTPYPTSTVTRERVEPIALQAILAELRAEPNTFMEFRYGKLRILASDWNTILDAALESLTTETKQP